VTNITLRDILNDGQVRDENVTFVVLRTMAAMEKPRHGFVVISEAFTEAANGRGSSHQERAQW
jgi:hypothetical protein